DIKPDNIILRQGTQEVVLIDFGIAREFNNGAKQTHTGLVSEGYAPIEQYLTQAQRTAATDVYGLAATLYALLTAQVPIPALLRDREKMPSPRELQPHLSGAVNQAVSRGMAVEPQFRPTTVAEWLQLLPGNGLNVTSSTLATQAVQTINLSDLKSKNFLKKATSHPIATPSKVANTGKKAGVSKGIVSISIALVAATAGFSMTRILSKPNLQSSPKPVIKQSTSESIPPKPVVEISPSSPNQKIQNSSFNESVPLRVRRKRKNTPVSPEPTPTNNSSDEEKAPENNNSQPTPTPNTTINKSTPVVTSSPSLMDTLRDAKESQKASPPPENTAPESNPVVTPPQESQPENSSAVVVPTVEINQNQVPESPQQKEEKPQ
ncbi:MAG: protein kinase domain-containing protein, partial [Dolichospermum sp.]